MSGSTAPGPEAPPPPRKRPWMWIVIAIVVVVVLAGAGAYLVLFQPAPAKVPTVVTYATSSEMVTLDPSTEFSNSILILPNVYEGLTRFNPQTQSADPLLATSWTKTPDGMNWTFTLRQGVTFHDGTPFNATAVKFSVDRTIRMGGGAAFIWGAVDHIEILGEYQVKFVLTYPAPIDWIATSGYAAWIFSPRTPGWDTPGNDTVKDQEMAKWFEQGHESGTGPYMLDASQYSTTRVVFERFDAYWGGWREGQFDKAVILRNADPAQREASLKAGEVDITIDVPVLDLPQLRNDTSVRVLTTPSYRAIYAFFNTGRRPTDDPLVRQALAYAIPYDDIVTAVVGGLGDQSRGIIPKGMWGHNESLPQYEFNLTKAEDLLRQAGHPNPNFSLRFTYTLGDLFEQKFGELWKEKLATLGITMDVVGLPWEQQWTEAQGGPDTAQDIFVMYWWPSYVTPYDFLFNMFHSASYAYFNLGYYRNPTFDATIDEAVSLEATDRDMAFQMYSQAQMMLYNDLPGLGIVDLQNLYLLKADLRGFQDNAGYPLVVFFYQLSR